MGFEPKVVGAAFATPANKITDVIEGNGGVYRIKTKSVVKAPAVKDFSVYTSRLKGQNASAVGRIIPALKESADIEDNRLDFGF